MVQKLKDFREEDSYHMKSGERVQLVTEILDLKVTENTVTGVFSMDFVRQRNYKRKPTETLVTEESPFFITSPKERTFMMVIAPSVARGVKKLLTNYVANKLSNVLFIRRGAIVEATIPHEILKELHEANPQATKLIWFDNVDIPGVEKLCLAGSDLADTTLYRDYLGHGKIWYVVFAVQNRGIVVGITRNCVVTLFSKSTIDELKEYISEELLTLIE